jgi:DNA-binding NarL/FixJ family response regulator
MVMPGKSSPRKPQAKRRILILDDHPLVRRGLIALIETEPNLSVCAEAATRREGLDAIASSRPDLVIIDLSLKDGNGLEIVKDIRLGHKCLPVLVLSMHDAPIHAERAFRAGAGGYVTKQEMGATVLIAIRRVLKGEKYVSPRIREDLAPR